MAGVGVRAACGVCVEDRFGGGVGGEPRVDPQTQAPGLDTDADTSLASSGEAVLKHSPYQHLAQEFERRLAVVREDATNARSLLAGGLPIRTPATLRAAFRPWRDPLTHSRHHVPLRLSRDRLWYAYESEPGRDDWWPRGTPTSIRSAP